VALIIDIGDVKPGDFGGAQFAFELCDNPGYVWLTGGLRDASENGTTEPEADDPDEEDGVVELLDEIQVAYSIGAINDDPSGFEDTDSGFQPVEQYTLREFLDRISNQPGTELAGTMNAELGGGTGEQGCFAGSPDDGSAVHQVSVVWWLPINHGNQVQSDSVTFDLGFYTEQCRHNDGEGMAPEDVTLQSDATGGVRETDNWITATVSPGSTTTITVELDGEVYGNEPDEWPNNSTSYVMEANVDTDDDGIGEAANTDDFRLGYAGSDSRNSLVGENSPGGYIRRNVGGTSSSDSANRTDVREEDVDGFSVTEIIDQLTYTIEIDWTSDDLPGLSSAPSAIKINEVFGSDGGNGVANPNNAAQDSRGDVDNTTASSGTLQF